MKVQGELMFILTYSQRVALDTCPIGKFTIYKYYNGQWKQDTSSKYFTMMFWLGGNSAQPKNKTELVAFLLLTEKDTYYFWTFNL